MSGRHTFAFWKTKRLAISQGSQHNLLMFYLVDFQPNQSWNKQVNDLLVGNLDFQWACMFQVAQSTFDSFLVRHFGVMHNQRQLVHNKPNVRPSEGEVVKL